ncbi:MAG TPA: nucleotidyltransferase domain-containing protein [Candidatus Nanoarchaeia archaeon]|nr:nucleotidyltransferase domain-containing protein [Candidatus Nanoarchaeia archaeon]
MTPFKPGIERILRIFYENKDKKLHLRELARRSNLYGQSITRYLKDLKRDNILNVEKEGNMKKYYLCHNKKVYVSLSFFDVERFEKLPPLRKKAIQYYLDTLEEKPVFAILFGSSAKDTYRERSDIDILLITNHKIKTVDAEKEAAALTTMKVSTFQIDLPEFKAEIKLKEDPTVQSALFSGYPIYNNGTYYEELYHERV